MMRYSVFALFVVATVSTSLGNTTYSTTTARSRTTSFTSTTESAPSSTESSSEPTPEFCNPLNCTSVGYCTDYTWCEPIEDFESPEWSGRWTDSECPEGLYWNANASRIHGGTCDFWENLPDETKQSYKRDPECIAHCYFESAGVCSGKYFYFEDEQDGTLTKHELECPQELVWDNDKRTCVQQKDLAECA